MRKVIALCLVLACASLAFSQEAGSGTGAAAPKLSVRFDAIGLIFCMFPVSAEYALTDEISLTADILYSPNFAWLTNISILDVVVGGRYYFGGLLPDGLPAFLDGPAPFGPFAGARLGFDTETWNWGSGYKGTYTSFGLGVEAGLKYFLKGRSGFYAEGVAGYMFYFPASWKWTYDGDTISWTDSGDPGFNPSRVTYGVSVGYAF